jgi:hypothetical protein
MNSRKKQTKYTNFEDIYLKTSYLKKIKNGDENFMNMYSIFAKSVHKIGGKFFAKNIGLLSSAGFGLDDVESFCAVQAWSYIELYSLQTNPEALQRFIAKRKTDYPERKFLTNIEICKKDSSNFMSFLSQRLSEFVRICRIKNRNIKGSRETQGFYIKEGPQDNSPISDFVRNSPEDYGYRKLTNMEVLDLKKEIGSSSIYRDLRVKDRFYLYVMDHSRTSIIEYDKSAANSNGVIESMKDNFFYKNPEEIIEIHESFITDAKAMEYKKSYYGKTKNQKIKVLKKRKKELTGDENHIRLLIDKKIMELSGEQKRSDS